MTLLSFIPARCWIAPLIPSAMYSSGATIFPVCPTCQSFGAHPASTAARDAPIAAFSRSASSSTSRKFSCALIPRPAETITRASVSSGRSDFVSCRETNAVPPASAVTATFSTGAFAPPIAAASNAVCRTVNRSGLADRDTVPIAFPAYIGRFTRSASPSFSRPTMSLARGASSIPDRRGMKSFPNVEAGANTAPYPFAFTTCATAPAYVTARYFANPDPSPSRTLRTPVPAATSATAPTPSPRTSASTSPPMRPDSALAADTTDSVFFLKTPSWCSTTTSMSPMGILLKNLRLGFQLRHQLRDIRHPAASRALFRRGVRENLHPRRRVHAQRCQRNDLQLLLLRLHDPGERRVPRLVQPQVRGHHRRERHLDRLQPAVDLAGHVRLFIVRGEFNLRREGRLRPPEHRREDLPHLVVVVVHRLLAHQHQLGLFVGDDLRQHFRHRQRIEVRPRLDQHRAVRAHRQRRAHLLLALLRADGHDDHFAGQLLPDPQRLLDRDLAKRVHDHLDVVQDDPAPVPLDLDLLVGVGDRLDGDQDLHVAPPMEFNASNAITYRKRMSKARMNDGSILGGAGKGRIDRREEKRDPRSRHGRTEASRHSPREVGHPVEKVHRPARDPLLVNLVDDAQESHKDRRPRNGHRRSLAGLPAPQGEQEPRDAVKAEVGDLVRPRKRGAERRVRDRRQRECERHPPRQHRKIQSPARHLRRGPFGRTSDRRTTGTRPTGPPATTVRCRCTSAPWRAAPPRKGPAGRRPAPPGSSRRRWRTAGRVRGGRGRTSSISRPSRRRTPAPASPRAAASRRTG